MGQKIRGTKVPLLDIYFGVARDAAFLAFSQNVFKKSSLLPPFRATKRGSKSNRFGAAQVRNMWAPAKSGLSFEVKEMPAKRGPFQISFTVPLFALTGGGVGTPDHQSR